MRSISALYLILLFSLCLALSSCKEYNLTPDEYIEELEKTDNGLHKEKTIGEYTFSLQYMPLNYIALLEWKKANQEDFSSVKKSLEGIEHFTLRIASSDQKTPVLRVGRQSQEEFQAKLDYFSYHFQNDLYLIEGNDTIKSSWCHFERSYDLTPYENFIIGFKRKEEIKSADAESVGNDKILLIKDRNFGAGIIKFNISAADIKNINKLKIKFNAI